jgi:excisionase family DNA binding protein
VGAVTSTQERLTLTVEEAAATLGISRAFAYEAVRRGEIPSIKIGRRVLVPRAALARLLDGATGDDQPPAEH